MKKIKRQPKTFVREAEYIRDIVVKLSLYCHEHLGLNNADIGRVFRRDRSDIKRMIDKNKPKGAK